MFDVNRSPSNYNKWRRLSKVTYESNLRVNHETFARFLPYVTFINYFGKPKLYKVNMNVTHSVSNLVKLWKMSGGKSSSWFSCINLQNTIPANAFINILLHVASKRNNSTLSFTIKEKAFNYIYLLY